MVLKECVKRIRDKLRLARLPLKCTSATALYKWKRLAYLFASLPLLGYKNAGIGAARHVPQPPI